MSCQSLLGGAASQIQAGHSRLHSAGECFSSHPGSPVLRQQPTMFPIPAQTRYLNHQDVLMAALTKYYYTHLKGKHVLADLPLAEIQHGLRRPCPHQQTDHFQDPRKGRWGGGGGGGGWTCGCLRRHLDHMTKMKYICMKMGVQDVTACHCFSRCRALCAVQVKACARANSLLHHACCSWRDHHPTFDMTASKHRIRPTKPIHQTEHQNCCPLCMRPKRPA